MLVQMHGQTHDLVGREPAEGAGILLDVRGSGDVVSLEVDVEVVPQVGGVPAVGTGEEGLARVGRGYEVVEAQGILVRLLKLIQVSISGRVFILGPWTSLGTWGRSRDFLGLFSLLDNGLVPTYHSVNVP